MSIKPECQNGNSYLSDNLSLSSSDLSDQNNEFSLEINDGSEADDESDQKTDESSEDEINTLQLEEKSFENIINEINTNNINLEENENIIEENKTEENEPEENEPEENMNYLEYYFQNKSNSETEADCYVCYEKTNHRSICDCKSFICQLCLIELVIKNGEHCSICKKGFNKEFVTSIKKVYLEDEPNDNYDIIDNESQTDIEYISDNDSVISDNDSYFEKCKLIYIKICIGILIILILPILGFFLMHIFNIKYKNTQEMIIIGFAGFGIILLFVFIFSCLIFTLYQILEFCKKLLIIN
tara:strand:+ start:19 stop:915 length:897 start_codon:yes stop_codon:yes gene_type:complete